MSTITAEGLRTFRETLGLDQVTFAGWLNERTNRNYDRNRISRWENGGERIPVNIAELIGNDRTAHSRGIPSATGPRQAYKIAVAMQKGGVGKTTSVVNLAWLLAKHGARVLVVDADAQANATSHLGADPNELDEEDTTLYHVLMRDKPLQRAVIAVCDGAINLLGSSITLSMAEAELQAEPNGSLVLRERLAEVETAYDVILIDCAPTLGLITVSALNAADAVLIPVQTEPMAEKGVRMLLDTIGKIRRRVNPSLEILGLLPTMYSQNLTMDRLTLERIKGSYGDAIHVFTPVASTTQYPQGSATGQPTLALSPDAPGAQAYAEVAARVIALSQAHKDARHGQ